ncbi:MAG TPA: (deoxy)nucleoside triphosphate pyrophosphohydrolase [Stellaceae bacterium]|jgi:8-oxo-dGTP diphosphatase|nr:(deoxy)nucleoside triphosphate pyrophosphohydrolase [Stellaceae bacterium]
MAATGADPLPIVPIVSVALIDGHGQVLLQQRPKGKAMAGLWEFPGGKIQSGEMPEAALCRELDEELGIAVAESDLEAIGFASHRYDTFHILLLLWVCRRWQGTPTPRETQVIAWTPPAAMNDYPMPAADAPLVTLLQQRL